MITKRAVKKKERKIKSKSRRPDEQGETIRPPTAPQRSGEKQ